MGSTSEDPGEGRGQAGGSASQEDTATLTAATSGAHPGADGDWGNRGPTATRGRGHLGEQFGDHREKVGH